MRKITYQDTVNCSISEAKVGESNGESKIYAKITFATKCLKSLAKVAAKVAGESGESSCGKSLILQAAKAKAFTHPYGVGWASMPNPH